MQLTAITAAPVAPTSAPAAPGLETAPAVPLATDSVISLPASAPTSGPRAGRQDDAQLTPALGKVLAADDKARVTVDPTSNAATFLSGQFGVVLNPGVGGNGPDRIARTFLVQHGALFGVADQANQLQLLGVDKDELGFKHFRYQQVQHGLPVFGQQLIVHSQGESVTAVAGRITPNIVAAEPRLAGDEAARRAIASTLSSLKHDGLAAEHVSVAGPQQLGWYTLQDGTPKLAYEVVVGSRENDRWQMYVDAQSGDVLDKWSLVQNTLQRQTIDAKTGKVRKEGDAPTNDAPLDAAHDHAKDVYDFYSTQFGRDSIDGKGMGLKSNVHYGNSYNNAFWNGSSMTYGDGDGKMFIPFSLGLDVVGHEMTHGVTERSAGLRYQRQSGALNESWSDVFGNLIEKWAEKRDGKPESDPTWLVGEDIFTPGVDGDGLRSMSNPGHGYKGDRQPGGNMKDYLETDQDNGGVHLNSGIPNKAAYEVAQAIGTDKTAKVWYRALTAYLTPSSQFIDAANVTVQAAIDLYGAGSPEAKAVAASWTSVGLAPKTSPGTPPATPGTPAPATTAPVR